MSDCLRGSVRRVANRLQRERKWDLVLELVEHMETSKGIEECEGVLGLQLGEVRGILEYRREEWVPNEGTPQTMVVIGVLSKPLRIVLSWGVFFCFRDTESAASRIRWWRETRQRQKSGPVGAKNGPIHILFPFWSRRLAEMLDHPPSSGAERQCGLTSASAEIIASFPSRSALNMPRGRRKHGTLPTRQHASGGA